MNDFTLLRLETDYGSYMVTRLLLRTLFQRSVGKCSLVCERLIKLDHKIILEIIGNPTAILR